MTEREFDLTDSLYRGLEQVRLGQTVRRDEWFELPADTVEAPSSEGEMSNKVLTTHPAPVGGVEPVRSVTHADYCAALEPLMKLLGTSLASVMADSISEVSPRRISFVTCEPVAGVEPIEWGSWDETCSTCGTDHDGHAATWGWPVTVEVVLP